MKSRCLIFNAQPTTEGETGLMKTWSRLGDDRRGTQYWDLTKCSIQNFQNINNVTDYNIYYIDFNINIGWLSPMNVYVESKAAQQKPNKNLKNKH